MEKVFKRNKKMIHRLFSSFMAIAMCMTVFAETPAGVKAADPQDVTAAITISNEPIIHIGGIGANVTPDVNGTYTVTDNGNVVGTVTILKDNSPATTPTDDGGSYKIENSGTYKITYVPASGKRIEQLNAENFGDTVSFENPDQNGGNYTLTINYTTGTSSISEGARINVQFRDIDNGGGGGNGSSPAQVVFDYDAARNVSYNFSNVSSDIGTIYYLNADLFENSLFDQSAANAARWIPFATADFVDAEETTDPDGNPVTINARVNLPEASVYTVKLVKTGTIAQKNEFNIQVDNAGHMNPANTVTDSVDPNTIYFKVNPGECIRLGTSVNPGGGNQNPGEAYILEQNNCIGFRDFTGNIFEHFYGSPENSSQLGYVQWSDGTGGELIPNTADPDNRERLDNIDWKRYGWTTLTLDSIEAAGGINHDNDTNIHCYELPGDAQVIRVVSESNYWCDVQNKDGQDNGYGYHAILTADNQIKKDNECSPDEIETGKKITVNVYKITRNTGGYIISFHPHSILWYNDAEAAERRGGQDAIITGGTVEFVSCSMPGSSNDYDGIIGRPEDTGLKDGTDNRVIGGQCSAKEGAILTLRFIPDYGYQFKKAEINGNPVTPQEDDYTFQFKFPQGTFHLSVTFEPGEDKASGSADGVGVVQAVSGTQGDDSINGNLMLAGSAAEPSAEQQAAMESAAEGASSDMSIIDGAYIDLSLQSYAEKGNTTDYWAKTIEETKEDVNVTIQVKDSVAAQIEAAGGECSVVRAHGKGSSMTYDVLPAVYNRSAKTITFASNKFSTFAIATGGEDTEIPEGPSTWKSKEGTEGLVYRLYNVALTREPESNGFKYWDNALSTQNKTAAEVAYGFIFSKEFKNKNYNNVQYVKMLYATLFGRDADEKGLAYWVGLLENGMSREYVYKGFAESSEFTKLCNSYNVERGSVQTTLYRDKNVATTGFVARLYTDMLGRKFDDNGLEFWCKAIIDGTKTPEDVIADGFLHSKEFKNANLSNTEFVTRMYRVVLNREPDAKGLQYWVERLDTKKETRESIIYGFTKSQEFQKNKAKLGL